MPFAVLRADASSEIGGGHVMRCLTLADELAGRGWRCAVACNGEARRTVPHLAGSRHELLELADAVRSDPAPLGRHAAGRADLLVVDHYQLDAQYEAGCRPWARRILAIDDLASRRHEADYVLDQTPGRAADDYRGLVPPACQVLAGAPYALLRPAFAGARGQAMRQRGGRMALGRILLSVGATDPTRITEAVLRAVRESGLEVPVDAIVGVADQRRQAIEGLLSALASSSRLHVNPSAQEMVELMMQADLAVGAGGVSALERCCLGLASLTLVLADNQRGNAQALQRAGAARVVSLDGRSLREELAALCRAPAAIGEMSRAAFAVTDGLGASRVAAVLDGPR